MPDFDILGRLHNNHHSSTNNSICTQCGLPQSQSRISQLSIDNFSQRTRIRMPICEGHANDTIGAENSELDNSFTTVSLSNNNTLCPPNSLSDCSGAFDNPHIPKKKVSFCSEVIVAQISGQEFD